MKDPEIVSAMADLTLRAKVTAELTAALDAGDPVRADRAYSALPAWTWPATVAPALRTLRSRTRAPAPDRDWHPDGFGSARGVR